MQEQNKTLCTCGCSKAPCNTIVLIKNKRVIGEYPMGIAKYGLMRPDLYQIKCAGAHLQSLNTKKG